MIFCSGPNKTKMNRRKNHNRKLQWKIFYANAQGIQGKKDGIQEILNDIKPDLVLLTETHLKNNIGIKFDGYTFIGKSRNEKSSGGVGILIKDQLRSYMSPITTTRDIEMIWVNIMRSNKVPYFIGVYYGKQESRVNKEEIEEEMETLMEEIMEKRSEGEIMIAMDGNGKIGILNEPISRNGRLLLDVFETTELQIMNYSQKCEGKITHRAKKKNEKDSAIDFILATPILSAGIQKILIDEEGLYRLKGKASTDHNSMIIDTNLSNIYKINKPKGVTWRMKAPSQCWEKFQKQIEEFSPKSISIMADRGKTVQHRYNLWMNHIMKIINETIGKTTLKAKGNKKLSHNISELRKKKRELRKEFQIAKDATKRIEIKKKYIETQKLLQSEMKNERMKDADTRFQKMIEDKNNFWKERQRIMKDNMGEWMTMKDENGKRIYGIDENLQNAADYYESLYTRQKGRNHEYQLLVEKEIPEMKINKENERHECNTIPTVQEIKQAIANKKNGKSSTDLKNEFLKKGGDAMVTVMYSVIKTVWEEEEVPKQWNESYITSVWKKKGDRELMKNQRGISVSSTVGMIMEELLNNRILNTITFTQGQGGGIKNYSTFDHLFLLRAVITFSIKFNKKWILTFYDMEKAYDHAEREHMLHMLWNKGVRGKAWRLTMALNENLTAKIKTPYGLSRTIQRQVGGKQGGKLMTTTFAKFTDLLSEEMHENPEMGVKIDECRIPILLFVDDVLTIAQDCTKQLETLDTVENYSQKHNITWGASKCSTMEIGKHKVQTETWTLGENIIQHQDHYKYLGDIVMRNGCNTKNLDDRTKKVKASTCSIISCAKSDIMSKIQVSVLLKLHETNNIPILLHNSETWILSKTDIQVLEKIDMWALKRMLNLPRTTPSNAIRHMTGTSYIKTRIEIKQCNYLWKILRRPPDSWIHHTFQVLCRHEIGWAKQVHAILEDYGLTTDWEEIKNKRRLQWRQEVQNAAEKTNQERLLSDCYKNTSRNSIKTKTSQMIQDLQNPQYSRTGDLIIKSMNKLHAKAIILGRYGMLQCPKNYKIKYGGQNCNLCGVIDDEKHRLEMCPKYDNILIPFPSISFDQIYTEDIEALKKVAANILARWNLEYGKNDMKT